MNKSEFIFKRSANTWRCYVKGIELKELCIIKIDGKDIETTFGKEFLKRRFEETVNYANENGLPVYEIPYNVEPQYFLTLKDAKRFITNLAEQYSLTGLINTFKEEY